MNTSPVMQDLLGDKFTTLYTELLGKLTTLVTKLTKKDSLSKTKKYTDVNEWISDYYPNLKI